MRHSPHVIHAENLHALAVRVDGVYVVQGGVVLLGGHDGPQPSTELHGVRETAGVHTGSRGAVSFSG